MDQFKERDLEQMKQLVELWRKKITILQEMFEESGEEIHQTYFNTLDELKLAVEDVNKRLEEVRKSGEGDVNNKAGELQRAFERTREAFNKRMATFKHQEF